MFLFVGVMGACLLVSETASAASSGIVSVTVQVRPSQKIHNPTLKNVLISYVNTLPYFIMKNPANRFIACIK